VALSSTSALLGRVDCELGSRGRATNPPLRLSPAFHHVSVLPPTASAIASVRSLRPPSIVRCRRATAHRLGHRQRSFTPSSVRCRRATAQRFGHCQHFRHVHRVRYRHGCRPPSPSPYCRSPSPTPCCCRLPSAVPRRQRRAATVHRSPSRTPCCCRLPFIVANAVLLSIISNSVVPLIFTWPPASPRSPRSPCTLPYARSSQSSRHSLCQAPV
jgi:hypothetical protein